MAAVEGTVCWQYYYVSHTLNFSTCRTNVALNYVAFASLFGSTGVYGPYTPVDPLLGQRRAPESPESDPRTHAIVTGPG